MRPITLKSATFAVVLTLLCSRAYATEMIPLSKYIASGDADPTYIALRCSALFTVAASLSDNRPSLQKQLLEKGEVFLYRGVALMGKSTADDIPQRKKRALKTIEQLGSKYIQSANESYLNQGRYFPDGGYLLSDISVCNRQRKS